MKPLLRKLHLWTGVALIVPMLAIAISGVLLLYTESIVALRLPSLGGAAVPETAADIAADMRTIDGLSSQKGWNLVRLPEPARPYYDVWLIDDTRAYLRPGATRFADEFSPLARPETLLYELHAHLLAGEIGEQVVAWLGVLLLLNTVVGVWLWLPRWRATRPSLLSPWPISRGRLLRSHSTWSALFILPVLLLVTTGVMTAFPDQTGRLMVQLFGGDKPQHAIDDIAFTQQRPDWQRVIESAQSAFQDDQLIYLFTPMPGVDGPIFMRTRRSAEWHPNGRSEIYIDPVSAEVIATTDAMAIGRGYRIAYSIFPLHAAAGGVRNLVPISTAGGVALVVLMSLSALAFLRRRRDRSAGQAP